MGLIWGRLDYFELDWSFGLGIAIVVDPFFS